MDRPLARRRFVALVGSAGIVTAASACSRPRSMAADETIPPTEDLMREHGLLSRVLLVYEEATRRLRAGQPLPADGSLQRGALIVRDFIEDYHQRQEEDEVFPRLTRRADLAGLIATLRAQHDVGRALTHAVLAGASGSRLADILERYVHMYRPHEAFEDTVVFPALRATLSEKELHEMGERFAAREERLFGALGFEKTRDQVLSVERSFDIADLRRYTPA